MHHCFSLHSPSHSVQLRETARNFFEKELAPHASDIDRDNDFPKFRVREMATLATLIAGVGGSGGAGESGSLVPEGGEQGRVGHLYQRVGSGGEWVTCTRGWGGEESGSLVPEGGEQGRVGHLYQRVGSGGEWVTCTRGWGAGESGSLVPEGGERGRVGHLYQRVGSGGEWVTCTRGWFTPIVTIHIKPRKQFGCLSFRDTIILIQQDIITWLSQTQLVCFLWLAVYKLQVLVMLSFGIVTIPCLSSCIC